MQTLFNETLLEFLISDQSQIKVCPFLTMKQHNGGVIFYNEYPCKKMLV